MTRLLCIALFAWALAGARSAQGASEWLYVGNNKAGTVSVIEVPGFRVIREIDVMPDQPARLQVVQQRLRHRLAALGGPGAVGCCQRGVRCRPLGR